MMESSALYLFIITNTDQSDKKVTHWWSFLDLHPKKRSFYFIVLTLRDLTSSFLKMIRKYNKILYGIKKFLKSDNKITLRTLKLSMQEYEKIKNMNRLNETTIDLLHLTNK